MISVIEINSIQNRIDREGLRFKLDLVYFVIVIGLNFYRNRLVLLLIEVNSLHFGLLLNLDCFLVRDIDFYSALRLNFLVANHDLDIEEARVCYAVLDCSICFFQISLVLLRLFIFLDLCDLQLCVGRDLGICIITKSDTIVLAIVITVKFQFACRISHFCRDFFCDFCAASCFRSFCVVTRVSCFRNSCVIRLICLRSICIVICCLCFVVGVRFRISNFLRRFGIIL